MNNTAHQTDTSAAPRDPTPSTVSWEPIKHGGSNFKTHTLVFEGDKARVKKSLGYVLFCSLFIFIGVVISLVMMPIFLFNGETGAAIGVGIAGAIFSVVGYIMLNSPTLCFDHQLGYYYCGKGLNKANTNNHKRQGKLEEVAALQIISEWVMSHSSNGGSSSYDSYELNLVFNDGERANVMDHGDLDSLMQDAERLGDFLAVPIWHES